MLSHTAGVVDIVERAAASLDRLRHALAASKTALVPELHGQADDVVSVGAQHGRNGGRIHTARHGDRDCVGTSHLIAASSLLGYAVYYNRCFRHADRTRLP